MVDMKGSWLWTPIVGNQVAIWIMCRMHQGMNQELPEISEDLK